MEFILIAVILVLVVAYGVIRNKKNQIELFKNYDDEEKNPIRNIEDIRSFFDLKDETKYTLDDESWDDLNMDSIFYKIDRSYSNLGEDMLYYLLRNPLVNKKEIKKRSKEIERLTEDNDLRAKCKMIFFQLGYDKKNRFIEMLQEELVENKVKAIIYNILGKIIPIICIVLCFVFNEPRFLIVLALVMWLNLFIAEKERKNVVTNGLLYLNRIIGAGKKISAYKDADIESINEITELSNKLSSISRKTSAINMFTMWGGFLEIFSMPLLIIESSYYNVVSEVKNNEENIIRIYELLGEIEAYISIVGFKKANKERICEPKFINDININIKNGIHPLIDEPVPNSINLERRGVVLTGTNMSGKSTFLRMIGTNIILAQTFNMALAEKYEGCIFNIVTSISPKDDVNAGKSLYMAEVEGILRIINALDYEVPVFCIIDEIFRGTNPVERVASSTAILKYINERNSITFVATHDREITDKLKDSYEFYNFSEKVHEKKGLSFDYKIKKGIAKTRNAIKVLEYVGYPKSIINYSNQYAEELDKK